MVNNIKSFLTIECSKKQWMSIWIASALASLTSKPAMTGESPLVNPDC